MTISTPDPRPSRWTFRRSLACAISGVLHVLRNEPNMRTHVVVSLLVVMAAGYLQLPPLDWAVLILAIGLVVVTETVNTAIEATVDLISPDYHPLAKIAKDIAAAAVLLAAATAILLGILILEPRFVVFLQTVFGKF